MPQQSEAETSLALAGIAKTGEGEPDVESLPEFVVYDDVPELVASQTSRSRPIAPPPVGVEAADHAVDQGPSQSPPAPATESPPVERPRVSHRKAMAPGSMQHVSQRTVYLLAVLVAVVAALAYIAGYSVGRRDTAHGRGGSAADGLDPVVVEGKVVYMSVNGTVVGDAGAVVVALPVGATPPAAIHTSGLRPGEPEPDASHPHRAAIERLGGAYLRADNEGAFSLVAPRPGRYYLLLVSHGASRPSAVHVDRTDLAMLTQYFARPSELLGSRKYRLEEQLLDGDTRPISHDFGRDRL